MTMIILLVIAYFLDGIIRHILYRGEVLKLRKESTDHFIKMFSQSREELNDAWEHLIKANSFRYGINGDFRVDDIFKEDAFGLVGNPITLGSGVVLDKQFISSTDLVDNMAKVLQNTKKKMKFDTTADMIEDKYFVHFYNQENINKKYTVTDKNLYNNVDEGDFLSLSLMEDKVLTIGYRVRGVRDENTNKKLDVGRVQTST